ncbi:MAG: hypothetical protein H0X63_11460 [Flavobacteriales bacterium]|nr:hypothetical protein [Flavobacteriales bacterium]
MQAEWGKGKKREKKEGNTEQQKDSGRFRWVLITFRIVNLRRTKTEGLEQKKAQAVNLGYELKSRFSYRSLNALITSL